MIKPNISPREKEVLRCLAQGMTTAETASALFVSHDTIKTHRSNLLLKLEVKNAFQLGVKVGRFNLISLNASLLKTYAQ